MKLLLEQTKVHCRSAGHSQGIREVEKTTEFWRSHIKELDEKSPDKFVHERAQQKNVKFGKVVCKVRHEDLKVPEKSYQSVLVGDKL